MIQAQQVAPLRQAQEGPNYVVLDDVAFTAVVAGPPPPPSPFEQLAGVMGVALALGMMASLVSGLTGGEGAGLGAGG